jgi:phosphoglycerate dehydrogenase-like enzyme
VTVCNTPGVNSVAVAELALGLMLAAARHIRLGDRWMRDGLWQQERGPELRGKTLGLIGLGMIAQRLAELGRGIGMSVIGWSFTPNPERAAALGIELVERDEVFRRADVVSLHVRSTPETRGFVGARELALMKPSAILVNTARGAVVDAPALREALLAGQIAGAGLDVHVPEPHTLEANLFKDLDNVVITPHLGGSSYEASVRTQRMTVDNIIAFLEGRPVNVANP